MHSSRAGPPRNVHGIDALDGLDDVTLAPLPVPVLLPPRHHRTDTDGIRYHQSKRRHRGEVIEEVPVTTLLRTAFDLARQAPDLTEAVVALDAFLGARRLKPETLQRSVKRLDGTRGVRQARQAVDLARVGVRSTWETRLRLLAVLELGLTELEPNRAVFDQAGNLLGVPDLLDAEAALAIEYDGATWRSDRAQRAPRPRAASRGQRARGAAGAGKSDRGPRREERSHPLPEAPRRTNPGSALRRWADAVTEGEIGGPWRSRTDWFGVPAGMTGPPEG